MNTKQLESKAQIMEKVIIALAPIYNQDGIEEGQKALLETLVGAGIWYMPSGDELYDGGISKEALEKFKSTGKLSDLTKEHRYPRKKAGKNLLSREYKDLISGEKSLKELYLENYGRYHYVVSGENKRLIKHQKAGDDQKTAYSKAGIELLEMSIKEIKSIKSKGIL